MRIGLDIHGVADEHRPFFRIMTEVLKEAGHEIHIITGLTRIDFDMLPDSKTLSFNHFYSITDDLMYKETYTHDIYGRPRFDEYTWNTAKANYCKENKIDIMLDDSDIYGKYFSTPYFQVRRIK